MTLRHLRYFAAVAEHGSLAGAARQLHIAQPALSRQIRALEASIGVPLLRRETRGVALTPAGARLVELTPVLFETLEAAVDRARRAHVGLLGTLRLGLGIAAVGDSRVGRLISAVRDAMPDVELVIEETSALDQAAALRDGRLDIGIGMVGESDDSFAFAQLFEACVDSVMISNSHPLAERDTIELDELREDKLLVLSSMASAGYTRVLDALRAHSSSEWETLATYTSIYGAIAVGRGWTATVASQRNGAPFGTVVRPTTRFSVVLPVVARWRKHEDARLAANALAIMTGQKWVPPAIEAPGLTDAAAHIELRHIESVVDAARQLSTAGTSHDNRLTQSGVSRRVQSVERAVGCRLVRRRGRTVTLTSAGVAFVAPASRVLAMADEALVNARRAHRGVSRVFRIGMLPAELTGNLMVEPLQSLARSHPAIDMEFHEMLTAAQRDALRRHEIDLAIGGSSPEFGERDGFRSAYLIDNPIECALIAAGHPLAKRSSLRTADLSTLPFLFIDRAGNESFYDVVATHLAAEGLSPDQLSVCGGARALWRIVADSAGWTIGTRLHRISPPYGLVAIPVNGLSIPWGLQAVWRANEVDALAQTLVETFIALLQP